MLMRWIALGAMSLCMIACDAPPGGAPRVDPFAATTERVVVEVDFQNDAEPFTGPTAYGDTWDLTVENVAALVGDELELEVPHHLDDMELLDDDDIPDGDLDRSEERRVG